MRSQNATSNGIGEIFENGTIFFNYKEYRANIKINSRHSFLLDITVLKTEHKSLFSKKIVIKLKKKEVR